MREIKFRAWSGKRMYYAPNDFYIRMDGTCFEIFEGEIDEPTCGQPVLMQYTGLKDKKGREIYEGDIVSTSDNGEPETDRWTNQDWGSQVVTFDEYGVCFGNWNWEAEDQVTSLKYIEVIGNIHENPELLEKK